jgi:hypothetical protein
MRNFFCCIRPRLENSEEPEITSSNHNPMNSEEPQPTPRNLADLIDAWIREQPVGNEVNLGIAKTRILQAHSERSARLDLTTLNLSTFPPLEELAPHLEKLDLSHNAILEIPDSIGTLQNLKELYLYQNQISSLPESFGNLQNLERLLLYRNQLSSLPESFGNLQNLKELFLYQNQISSLPESFGNLQNLTTLWIQDNNNITHEQLPQSIITRENNGRIRLVISYAASPGIEPTNNPSTDFFTIIENNANFTAEEKSQIATQALAIDYSKTNNCDQDLQSNLNEIKGLLERQDGERNIEPLTKFLTRLVLEDGSYNRADAESQKLLSRQILEVLLIINDKKNDEEFIKGALGVCQVGQVSCGDRTALYFYYLKNFVSGKTAPELDSMFQQFQHEDLRSDEARLSQSHAPEDLNPKKLIESLKNQATFNYILKMAESKCKKIKEANSSFNEDVEVYINYLRIFNRELLTEGIDSKLPAIQNQMHYTGVGYELYQPNSNEIADLTKVLKSENASEIATFLAHNIRDETSTTMICSLDETKIYKTINLAVSDITGSYIDIENFSGSSEQFQNTANELQEIRKEIISSELKELLVKILNKEKFKIDFDENKITEIKKKIENNLQEKGFLPSRETIPTLAQNASQPSISDSLALS